MHPPSHACRHRLTSLTATTCSECGLPLTLGTLGHHYSSRFRDWLVHAAVIECPHCGWTVPVNTTRCPSCEQTISVGAAFRATVGPPRQRLQAFVRHPSPRAKILLQGGYLLTSVLLFTGQVSFLFEGKAEMMFVRAALSVPYVAALALATAWLVPLAKWRRIGAYASGAIKLAFIFNYLSLLLLIQTCIGSLLWQASIVAGLFATTAAAGWLLHRCLWPIVAGVRQVFRHEEGSYFDPSQPQGRHGEYE